MAEIYSIMIKPSLKSKDNQAPSFSRIGVEEAMLEVGHGIKGDAKGSRHPDRQLNILSFSWIEGLQKLGYKTTPGSFGEQLIITGLDVEGLASGERLYLGEIAVIEIVKPRTGCERLEAAQDGLPVSGFGGEVGMLARVILGGVIRIGDPVITGEKLYE